MVLRWCRQGIALIWKYRSRGRRRSGRQRIALETRQPIRAFGPDVFVAVRKTDMRRSDAAPELDDLKCN
jgi:hypothetical protein